MIRKILFTLSLLISATLLKAQCTPDTTYTKPGIYPDTATNLPVCYANFPYAGVITAVVPADTNSLPVDSMGVIKVTGLPTGFNWTTDTHSHFWHGGKTGCFVITGTASHAQVGTYHLAIFVNAYVIGFLTLDTVFGFKIIVKDSVLGVNDGFNKGEAVSINTFNEPSRNSFTITVHSLTDLKNASLILTDITGREMMRFENLNGKEFSLIKSGLSNGIYIVSLIDNKNVIAKKEILIK